MVLLAYFSFVMGNVDTLLKNAKNRLKSADINPMDAEFLLCAVLGVEHSELYGMIDISNTHAHQFDTLIDKRLEHYSMDRLIGYTEFLGLKIPFSEHTLSPRQETEIMTDEIIRSMAHGKGDYSVLDMCTGSGCIGLSIAKHTGARVTLVDISPDAIERARSNAQLNGVDVNILESNLFDNVHGLFDIIISNPPYIESGEINGLEREVLQDDPIIALDGGADGLDFYRRIVADAPAHLKSGGKIYLEIGYNQASCVVDMMTGKFRNIVVHKDYAGLDRYIEAEKL